MFAWLPNASWVGDTLSGYVFSVDGSKKPSKIGGSSERRLVAPSTPVVPDMFSADKMLYGMLCIRLTNTKKNKLGLNPIDSLELYSEKDMDVMLRETISDDMDLSSEGSYAGFYISEDPTREWERNGWIVISTGDLDISRTIHEYLKGDYNPYRAKDKRPLKDIVDDMKRTLDQVKRASASKSKSGFDARERSDDGDDDDEEAKEENVDDMIFPSASATANTRERSGKKSRKKDRKKRSSKRRGGKRKTEQSRRDNEHEEAEILKSTTDRLLDAQLPEEERCAWKYAKLIKEIHRLIQVHATNAASNLDSSPEDFLGGYEGEPECVNHRDMRWEGHLMKESFISTMILRMKEKRWLVASKLAGILGFDLIQDFGIDPFDKNIDNHHNVIHVTTNTFSQNRRTAKMVYYAGSYCKHEMEGGLPVPVSPLQGIHILKGPPKRSSITSGSRTPSTTWSNTSCISSARFRMAEEGSGTAASKMSFTSASGASGIRSDGQRAERKAKSTRGGFLGSSESTDDETSSSEYTDDSEDYESSRYEAESAKIVPISGEEKLRIFKLCSYANVDGDDDMGGQWLLNKESRMSIDCKGAFPYGTGRCMAYLHILPPGNTGEEEKNYERKVQRMMSSGRLPDHMVPTSEWGPRGVWVTGGSDGIRARQGRRVLFTWENVDYPTHPRLARGVFRDRVKGFQTRETHMGWNPTFGSLNLQPKAVILHSPINPLE
jgi:hypothetical protein